MFWCRQIIELVAAYRKKDPAAKGFWEVLLLYPGIRVLAFHTVAHWFYQRGCFFCARVFGELGRGLSGIEIHPGARFGARVVIDHGMGVVVGETAVVGDDCLIYHGVTLGGVRREGGLRHPQVGREVVLGAGAKVLGPVRLGDRCRVGANAVVIRDVSEGVTVVGVPAKWVHETS